MTDFSRVRAALADVVAIPVTPFAADGTVDTIAYRALLRRLLDAGVRTVTPNGNTGEFYALSPEERLRVVELTVAEVGDRAEVVVGVGHDLVSAVAAARHAGDTGASMIMVHQPVHPYVSQEGWVAYQRTVADAVPGLGVVPYIRDPLITAGALARLGALCPNVIGVKYAVPDATRFAAFAQDAGRDATGGTGTTGGTGGTGPDRFVWVAGLAELYAPAYWAGGATGFTSGLVNVAPDLSLALLAALRAGDAPAARAVCERIRPFEELRAARHSADNVSVVKEALAALGLCRRDVRPPSSTLPAGTRAEIAALVRTWDA
ncbi:dihydrodipicolinate synthase family protein [Streptomyces sp. SID3212]|uniref:dihydrodipicolinate synthase family protein n=1 Tax=Streptomyces sp. SID3212 TaxID=2690259 RepID=UPI0013CBD373|nr:dihydrodipicolinate synthase family protein [Streptomyces sp. SID3212]